MRRPMSALAGALAVAALGGCGGGGDQVELTYVATTPAGGAPTAAMLSRTADLVQQRLDVWDTAGASVEARPPDSVVVKINRDERVLAGIATQPGELRFYDWERNIVPNPSLKNVPAGEAYFDRKAAATRVAAENPGTIVVEKEPIPRQKGPSGFFVIHDRPSLTGEDITNPKQDFDPFGNPDVTFGFTDRGRAEFSNLTKAVAERGRLNAPPSAGGNAALAHQYSGHFAIMLDGAVVSRPIINFVDNPNGIDGRVGAEINGLALPEAQDLAKILELGPLPVRLVPERVQTGTKVSSETASVTTSTP